MLVGAAAGAVPPAGVGVAGTAFVDVDEDWTGAAGGAGVDATAGAGVEGAFELDAEGAALGWFTCQYGAKLREEETYLRYHTDYESLLLNLVRLNGVGILENLA